MQPLLAAAATLAVALTACTTGDANTALPTRSGPTSSSAPEQLATTPPGDPNEPTSSPVWSSPRPSLTELEWPAEPVEIPGQPLDPADARPVVVAAMESLALEALPSGDDLDLNIRPELGRDSLTGIYGVASQPITATIQGSITEALTGRFAAVSWTDLGLAALQQTPCVARSRVVATLYNVIVENDVAHTAIDLSLRPCNPDPAQPSESDLHTAITLRETQTGWTVTSAGALIAG